MRDGPLAVRDGASGEEPASTPAGYSARALSLLLRTLGSSIEISATAEIASRTVLIGRVW